VSAIVTAALGTNVPGIVTGSWDCTVRIWDLDTGSCLAECDVGTPVMSLAWAQAQRRVIVGADHRLVALELQGPVTQEADSTT
jgi:WD40 repeat protein